MAISIDSIAILQDYLRGVRERAEHHAGDVEDVVLALLGAVIWKADGEITVREYTGSPANVIWFWVNDKKYAMAYNHATSQIELKDRTQSGTTIAVFDNNSTYQQIIAVFNSL